MVAQLLANGFIMGCSYALIALGFGLIYNTTRIFHIAHGAVYTTAAYLFYTLHVQLHWHVILAGVITTMLAAFIGILINELVYQPFAKQGASLLILLLASLGLYIAMVNTIAMIYGNETKVLSPGLQPSYTFFGIILTHIQIVTALVAIALFIMLVALLRATHLGKLIRAVRDDVDLVSALGIDPALIHRTVFGIGSALAAVAAILQGLDVGIDPHIGMAAVLNGAVAVIMGGVGIFEGAALGGVLLGLLQSLVVWKLSARWMDAVTFVVLILFLIFRPQGLLGYRRRIEEVVT